MGANISGTKFDEEHSDLFNQADLVQGSDLFKLSDVGLL
jgi:hypothetical protein